MSVFTNIWIRRLPVILLFLLGLLWTNYAWFRVPFWPPKAGLLVSADHVGKVSVHIDPTIPVLKGPGYDSQFFWAMAQDPFMRNHAIMAALDSPAYRYQRILLPLVCYLLPGSVYYITEKLILLNILGWLLCLILVYRFSVRLGISAFVPLSLFFLNGGLYYSILHPMADVWAATLTLGGIYLLYFERYKIAGILFGLATLSREISAIVPLAYFLSFCWQQRRLFAPPQVYLAVGQLPAILWAIYIYFQTGKWGFLGGSGNFQLPVLNLFQVLQRVTDAGTGTKSAFIASILLFFLGVLCFVVRKTLLPGFFPAVFSQVILIFFAGPAILEQNASSSRLAVLLILLLPISLLPQNRKAVA